MQTHPHTYSYTLTHTHRVGMGLYFKTLEWLLILFACITFLAVRVCVCVGLCVCISRLYPRAGRLKHCAPAYGYTHYTCIHTVHLHTHRASAYTQCICIHTLDTQWIHTVHLHTHSGYTQRIYTVHLHTHSGYKLDPCPEPFKLRISFTACMHVQSHMHFMAIHRAHV